MTNKFIFLAIVLFAGQALAEVSYTWKDKTLYCPDSCSIRGPKVLTGETTTKEFMEACKCTCNGVESQCSETQLAGSLTSWSVMRSVVAGCVVALSVMSWGLLF